MPAQREPSHLELPRNVAGASQGGSTDQFMAAAAERDVIGGAFEHRAGLVHFDQEVG
jgi:hypothetical protein